MKKSWVLALCAAAALAACGGGDDTPSVTQAVPPVASATPTSFIDYLREHVMASAEGLEPVDVSEVSPKTDDTAEPSAVD